MICQESNDPIIVWVNFCISKISIEKEAPCKIYRHPIAIFQNRAQNIQQITRSMAHMSRKNTPEICDLQKNGPERVKTKPQKCNPLAQECQHPVCVEKRNKKASRFHRRLDYIGR